MINTLLLLLGLTNPFAVGIQDTYGLPLQSAFQPALWLAPVERLETFDTLGGISLEDDMERVLSKKGEPDTIEKDQYTGYTELHYGRLTVGIYEDLVYYVHMDPPIKQVMLNGIAVPLEETGLAKYVGEPDFIAEDGDVYIRGFAALKVYKDPSTGQITGVDLFDDAVS